MNMQAPVPVDASEDTFTNAVNQLLTITKVNMAAGQIAAVFGQKSKASIAESSPAADPIALAETLKAFEEEFQKEVPSLVMVFNDLYQQAFSEADVQDILAFYASDIGQKFLLGQSKMEQSLQGAAQGWAKAASKRAFERATARVNRD